VPVLRSSTAEGGQLGDWLVGSRSLGPAGLPLAALRQSLSPSLRRLKSADDPSALQQLARAMAVGGRCQDTSPQRCPRDIQHPTFNNP
jgi:hypothetical protein